jgi:glycosyltransferase involved in cell wall biosynthesis
LLTTSFPLSEDSSSGIFISRLVEHMPAGTRISVLTPAAADDTPLDISGRYSLSTFRYAPKRWQRLAHCPGGIPVALAGNRLNYLLIPAFLASMFVHFLGMARRADLLHANWAICACIAGLIGRLLRRPLITTLRGEDVTRARTSRIHRLILGLAVRFSSRIVTVSDAFRDWIVQTHPDAASRVSVIENGVDMRFLAIGEEKRTGPESPVTRLLAVGSLIPRKGIDQIISALALVENPGRFSLTLIGSGPERERLEQQAETLKLSESVDFAGEVRPDHVSGYLREADILLLASHSEGRPNVVLEAMAAGLPVIATDIEGVNELVTDKSTGLLFSDGNIEQFANHLDLLISNSELRIRYGANAHQAILDRRLLWRHTATRYHELYQSVLANQLTTG